MFIDGVIVALIRHKLLVVIQAMILSIHLLIYLNPNPVTLKALNAFQN